MKMTTEEAQQIWRSTKFHHPEIVNKYIGIQIINGHPILIPNFKILFKLFQLQYKDKDIKSHPIPIKSSNNKIEQDLFSQCLHYHV